MSEHEATPAQAPGAETAFAPEAAEAAVPEVRRQRQWVTLRGGSMDVRGGLGISSSIAHDLRSVVGKPHSCALVSEPGAPEALLEGLHRDLSDEGFSVRRLVMPGGACDLARVQALDGLLAEERITSDDLVVAVGGYETLSVASFACSSWCGGTSLAEVPLDAASAIVAGATPRALDLPGLPRMVTQDGSARFSIVDIGLFDLDPAGEPARLSFALMAQTATCDSNKAFERLWDVTDDLVAGDVAATLTQLLDTVKSRGRVVSSTAVSTRQSIAYAMDLARPLRALLGPEVPDSTLIADGMRFAARLAAALAGASLEFVAAQDDLLDALGLPALAWSAEPADLLAAMKRDKKARHGQVRFVLPRDVGSWELRDVDDAVILEHLEAWARSKEECS